MSEGGDEFFDRLVDLDRLEAYMTRELGEADRYNVTRHAGGSSNETLFVTWDDRTLVLRRPPPGETADAAHEILREYTVLEALQDTTVPVPETVLSCSDTDVIGAEFYLMEHVDGRIYRLGGDEQFGTPGSRRQVSEALVSTLASIHSVDVEAAGLNEFGRPAGFPRRQVERWAKQYEWAFEVTAAERAVPAVEEVTKWLLDAAPTDHPTGLVHGDYSIANVLFAPEEPPRIAAVLDWEMATLGDPLTDLGWLLLYWPADDPPHCDDLYTTPFTYLHREGYADRRHLVERYEAESGIAFTNRRFYRALASYKLGAICEMMYRRYIEGNSDSELHGSMADRVPALAKRARAITRGTLAL